MVIERGIEMEMGSKRRQRGTLRVVQTAESRSHSSKSHGPPDTSSNGINSSCATLQGLGCYLFIYLHGPPDTSSNGINSSCATLQGLGCGACGVGCGVWGFGFRDWGLGFGCWVWGVGCGVWGVGCGVWGVGSGLWGLWLGVHSVRFWV